MARLHCRLGFCDRQDRRRARRWRSRSGTTWRRHYATPLAVAAVAVLTGVNLLGITRTALLTRILLAVVLATLVFVAAASLAGPASGRRSPPYRQNGLRVGARRRLGRPAGGGADVFRLRRLCADRHPGRGGQGPGPDHPAGHPGCAGCGLRHLPRPGRCCSGTCPASLATSRRRCSMRWRTPA